MVSFDRRSLKLGDCVGIRTFEIWEDTTEFIPLSLITHGSSCQLKAGSLSLKNRYSLKMA